MTTTRCGHTAAPPGAEQPLVRFGREVGVEITGNPARAPVLRVRPQGTVELWPRAGQSVIRAFDEEDRAVFVVSHTGRVYARHERPEQVWIGASGPGSQAGIAFGRAYRSGARQLRVAARLIVEDGLSVGDSEESAELGAIVQRLPLRDLEGKLIGYVPIHQGSER